MAHRPHYRARRRHRRRRLIVLNRTGRNTKTIEASADRQRKCALLMCQLPINFTENNFPFTTPLLFQLLLLFLIYFRALTQKSH